MTKPQKKLLGPPPSNLSAMPKASSRQGYHATHQFFTLQNVMLRLIRLYQLTLSPLIGRQCRFYPTCSHYARDAIETHGAVAGALMAIKRLLKCHPFHPGGVDLVPSPAQNPNSCTSKQHAAHGSTDVTA